MPGAPWGHPRGCQANGLGVFSQQAPDVGGGNMPLHDIATDFCRMAGGESLRHAGSLAGRRNIIDIPGDHAEASFLHVFNPFFATAAVWALEHFNTLRRLRQVDAGKQ